MKKKKLTLLIALGIAVAPGVVFAGEITPRGHMIYCEKAHAKRWVLDEAPVAKKPSTSTKAGT